LSEVTSSLGKTYERLSSGLRINRASDDAAGLAVASKLNVDARIFSQGVRNVNDAVSMLDIAGGVMDTLGSIMMRIEELAIQAANGTLSSRQRQALDLEAQALKSEFGRIVDSAEFNGSRVITASGDDLIIQAGGNSISLNGAALILSGENDGTFRFGQSTGVNGFAMTADLNNDGNLDIIVKDIGGGNPLYTYLGNGDGTFRSSVSSNSGGFDFSGGQFKDLNGDGYLDFIQAAESGNYFRVALGLGDGRFATSAVYSGAPAGTVRGLAVEDFTGDGVYDVIASQSNGTLSLYTGTGSGTFTFTRTFLAMGSQSANITAGDFNNDGKLDLVVSHEGSGFNTGIILGNGDGTFRAVSTYPTGLNTHSAFLSDFNNDGNIDLTITQRFNGNIVTLIGNGDGTFRYGATASINAEGGFSVGDFNNDGITDIVGSENATGLLTMRFGNSDGSFRAAITQATALYGSLTTGDFNKDGITDLLNGGFGVSPRIFLGNGVSSTKLRAFNLGTQDSALASLELIDNAKAKILGAVGIIGSNQSRLSVAANNLRQAQSETLAAASQILDADVATEAAELVRKQILQRSAQAVLAQANQLPQLALRLLQGGF
jgi:flagellin-like hook-associated protein FlgL